MSPVQQRSRLVAIAAALVAGAALPATAGARLYTFGSKLKATPSIVEAHPVDSAFWPVHRASSGGAVRAPASGQVIGVRIKGTVLKTAGSTPLAAFHLQNLAQRTHGRVKVLQTSATFKLPVGGDPNKVSTYSPVNLCVRKGNAIGFNDEGGFTPDYPSGAPFQIFAADASASTARFTKSSGTLNGATLTPKVRGGEELLMQVVIGTGKNEDGACRAFNRSRR